MAIYRNVSLSFWTDTKVTDDFSPEDRYFMLYCLTNPHTNIVGCYEISLRQMANETGYNIETIEKILNRFNNTHRIIQYDKETKELYVMNWHKYNWTKSAKILKPILSVYKTIKSEKFKSSIGKIINEIYGEDTVSIGYQYPIDTTDSDTVTDTVSDTVSDSITDTDVNKSNNKAKKEKKHKYGEYNHVLLSDTEVEKLRSEYGEEMTDRAVVFLDEYIEMKGYKAKSHYLCIRKWVVDAVKEKMSKVPYNARASGGRLDFLNELRE